MLKAATIVAKTDPLVSAAGAAKFNTRAEAT
jgi:hypothetical protein